MNKKVVKLDTEGREGERKESPSRELYRHVYGFIFDAKTKHADIGNVKLR